MNAKGTMATWFVRRSQDRDSVVGSERVYKPVMDAAHAEHDLNGRTGLRRTLPAGLACQRQIDPPLDDQSYGDRHAAVEDAWGHVGISRRQFVPNLRHMMSKQGRNRIAAPRAGASG